MIAFYLVLAAHPGWYPEYRKIFPWVFGVVAVLALMRVLRSD